MGKASCELVIIGKIEYHAITFFNVHFHLAFISPLANGIQILLGLQIASRNELIVGWYV